MGEKMSLQDVRDWHLKRVEFFSHGGMPWGAMAHESQQCADAITAHLTQPAQAVDVEKVLEVIEQTREYYERTDDRRTAYALENVLSDIYETLTAALPNANGKESPDAAR